MNRNQRRMAAYNAMKASQTLEVKAYCKKIDRAFSRLSEDCSNRVLRATSLGSLRYKKYQEEQQTTNRLYYSKPTREMGVTCVGRQKMKLGSKPLI